MAKNNSNNQIHNRKKSPVNKSAGLDVLFSFQIQDHAGRVLQVGLPQVGEPTHGGSVDDSVICRPAYIHDMCFHHLVLFVKPG